MATLDSDLDPQETREWRDALRQVADHHSVDRACFLLQSLSHEAARLGVSGPALATPYQNTLRPSEETVFRGDESTEIALLNIIGWNAVAMVVRAGHHAPELGGHLSTYSSIATLYEVGFNHIFRRHTEHLSDLVYFQGHASPGIYARAYLEGRFDETHLENFRQEIGGHGLSSYPHPWLMPSFWQFATVSMGLGPLQAIYQARLMRYLTQRGLLEPSDRKVFCFCGDGEMDEPESLGALSVAAREGLDSLIFVINCNLQRLDGPVRGNGNIIQELESFFRGAGWHVIKVIWNSAWDRLFARDRQGVLAARLASMVDGAMQPLSMASGAMLREALFSGHPDLEAMVEGWSDEDFESLRLGGHDLRKVFAAYHAALKHQGSPSVILARTVKGYRLGPSGEGQNTAHNLKKMGASDLCALRDRLDIPLSNEAAARADFYKPTEDHPALRYLRERRQALGGPFPVRLEQSSRPFPVPAFETFEKLLQGTGGRPVSTTMFFVRWLTQLLKDPTCGRYVVPIVADESRTFGMEGLFRQVGIYAPEGQKYRPVDAEQVMYYRESEQGQMLQEGISEAGAFASWLAAATAYSNHNLSLLPVFIFYSMFGFQRIGDLAWAASDMRAKGFLFGATAGRTTLAGEGLQHQDGHSLIMASLIPTAVAYDPCFGYELITILQHGMERMFQKNEPVYFYITLMNENYEHPSMPEGVREGIIRGLYCYAPSEKPADIRLLGGGAILREVLAAVAMLEEEGLSVSVYSATSYSELERECRALRRAQMRGDAPDGCQSYLDRCINAESSPIVAATDYVRQWPELIRPYVKAPYYTLGTDGFGRSDTREHLRSFFEVSAQDIAYQALYALFEQGRYSQAELLGFRKKLHVTPNLQAPWLR